MTQTENPTKEELRKWTNAPAPPGGSTPSQLPTSEESEQPEELLQPEEFDPKNEREGRPLSARPAIKAIAAAAILSPIVLIGLVFANGMPKAKLKPATTPPIPTPSEEPLSEADVLRRQLAEEKARVALLKQGGSKPIQAGGANTPPQSQKSGQRSKPPSPPPRRYSTVPAASIPVNRQSDAYTPRSYPQRSIPLRQYTPPTPTRISQYQPTQRFPQAKAQRAAVIPAKTTPSAKPAIAAVTKPETTPDQKWAELALLGSYGQGGSNAKTAQQESTLVAAVNATASSTTENATPEPDALVAPVSAPAAPDAQSNPGASTSTEGLDQEVTATAGEDLTPATTETPSDQEIAAQGLSASNALATEESAILQGTTLRTLKPGTSTKAVLQTHLTLPAEQEQQTEDLLIVRLEEALFDKAGLVLYEQGTELVARVVSSEDNGLVRAEVTAAMVGGIETPIPAGVLLIRGKGGRPLVAERYRDKGGRNWGQIALGGLSKAAEVLNRNTTVSFSGSSTTTISESSDPDVVAGAVEGATDAWEEQIAQRNDQTMQDAQDRSKLWFLEAGTAVEVFVNKPAVLSSHPADHQMEMSVGLGESFSPLAISDNYVLEDRQVYSLSPTVLLPFEQGVLSPSPPKSSGL